MKVSLEPVIKILSRITFIPIAEIHGESDVFLDLGLDSLGIVETFVALEREFHIKLNPATYSRGSIQTPLKILALLQSIALE